MVRSGNSEHVRFRYGMCLNENCSKCKSKEVLAFTCIVNTKTIP